MGGVCAQQRIAPKKGKTGCIIGVEGVCCAGKTTLCDRLEMIGEGIKVPESSVFLPSHSDYPPPSTNAGQARFNNTFYLALEVKRWSVACDIKNRGQVAFLDRCLISTLTIAYGLQIYKGFLTACEALKDYALMLINHQISLPDCYIHLTLPETHIRARNQTRANFLQDDWVHPDFVTAQETFYMRYYAETGVPVYKVDSGLGADEAFNQVLTLIGEEFPKISLEREMCAIEYMKSFVSL